MKKVFLFIAAVLLQGSLAHAYIVDGNVSDWGVNLGIPGATARHYLDNNVPTSTTADYYTEDNAKYTDGNILVGPAYSNGNTYDAEAIYFDNDSNNVYLAIITGVSPTEGVYPSGDIFIDTGKYQDILSPFYDPKKFEYGIDIATSKLYRVDSWVNPVTNVNASSPWQIGANRTYIADVPFVYSGQQNTHYVLEASVPLNKLSLNEGDDAYLHWTMMCGNDILNLHGSVNVVPEPATYALLASGLMMGISRFRRRSVKV